MTTTIEEIRLLFENQEGYLRLRSFKEKFPNEPQELLIENRIWFSDIRSQDDIFEGNPLFKWRDTPSSLQEIEELTKKNMHGAPMQNIKEIAHGIFNTMQNPAALQEMKNQIESKHRNLYNGSSIVSFFKDTSVQRHWSEYADFGRGYGLIFDFSEPWHYHSAPDMEPIDAVPFEVIYVGPRQRQPIELSIAPINPNDAFDEIERALLTKSNHWENQKEERLFRLGIASGHVSFPSQSLKALIFGYNIDDSHRNNLVTINSQREDPLLLLQSRISEENYEIEFVGFTG